MARKVHYTSSDILILRKGWNLLSAGAIWSYFQPNTTGTDCADFTTSSGMLAESMQSSQTAAPHWRFLAFQRIWLRSDK